MTEEQQTLAHQRRMWRLWDQRAREASRSPHPRRYTLQAAVHLKLEYARAYACLRSRRFRRWVRHGC